MWQHLLLLLPSPTGKSRLRSSPSWIRRPLSSVETTLCLPPRSMIHATVSPCLMVWNESSFDVSNPHRIVTSAFVGGRVTGASVAVFSHILGFVSSPSDGEMLLSIMEHFAVPSGSQLFEGGARILVRVRVWRQRQYQCVCR